MKLKYALPLAALALTGIGAQVAQAQGGTDPTASATFKSKLVRVDRSTAVLKVKYQCSKGSVLWISAKQLANGKAKKSLTKEGSSQVAKTWVQSHRNPITCDGASHTQVFTLDKVEPGSKGRLKAKGKHNARQGVHPVLRHAAGRDRAGHRSSRSRSQASSASGDDAAGGRLSGPRPMTSAARPRRDQRPELVQPRGRHDHAARAIDRPCRSGWTAPRTSRAARRRARSCRRPRSC